MTDDLDEIRFLEEKAAQFRALAQRFRPPAGNELVQIAEEFEQRARDLRRRRSTDFGA
ncbi:MAG: hypothetical protein KGL11_05885 [Alphaproteobacteria bacterium]|nr:hypothetical protein [Alphaproteobacteria bacterium]